MYQGVLLKTVSREYTESMKSSLLVLFGIILISTGIFAGTQVYAAVTPISTPSTLSLYRPFGGKVISTTNPAITCINTEGGPIMITPVRAYPPGPYATTLVTRRHSYYVVKPGSWIIGLYNPIPDVTTCINPETGAPVPVFAIKVYGISKGIPIL